MMEYEYLAIDKEGKRVKSFMKADSADAVATSLRDTGSKPLKITMLKNIQSPGVIDQFLTGGKRVTTKELVIFTRQLGTVLSAGVLLTEAIETIADDLENAYFSEILGTVIFHIKSGESFSKALEHHPTIFSPYYVAIVGSGEAVGRLGPTVGKLANFMEEDEKMRLKFLAAMRYPIFLMSFVFCIVSGIVLFLIPRFKVIFQGAGIQLPLLTRIVVGISEFSLNHILLIIIVLAVLGVVAWQALQIFRIRFMVDYWLLRIPIVGKVMRKAFIARFCQTLAMLLDGGVGIITALSLSGKVMDNYFLKFTIDDIRHSVMAGASLSEAMHAHADMPRILVKMVAVGEKAGMVSDMVKRIGDYHDQEVERFLNNINSLLEPIFIIIIGAVVMVVALALYLPIFQMSSVAH
jgi:type II secretory pathway component PulF